MTNIEDKVRALRDKIIKRISDIRHYAGTVDEFEEKNCIGFLQDLDMILREDNKIESDVNEEVYCNECGNDNTNDMEYICAFSNGDQYLCKRCQNLFLF